jgi:hypothetical protein
VGSLIIGHDRHAGLETHALLGELVDAAKCREAVDLEALRMPRNHVERAHAYRAG